MNFFVENPNSEVLNATLKYFKDVFGANRLGNMKITHIEFKPYINKAFFYIIETNKEEKTKALNIKNENQLLQVLTFITLGMEFDDIKQFLEQQDAI